MKTLYRLDLLLTTRGERNPKYLRNSDSGLKCGAQQVLIVTNIVIYELNKNFKFKVVILIFQINQEETFQCIEDEIGRKIEIKKLIKINAITKKRIKSVLHIFKQQFIL